MQLCFGTFTTVLNCCRSNVSQAAFIAKIVDIIDPNSRYKGEAMAGDGPSITKLLSCTIEFVFSSGNVANIPDQNTVAKLFDRNVSPFIDEDKKSTIIITLLDIIQQDEHIDSDKKETFKKFLGLEKQQLLQKSDFIFPAFLGQILLYTIWGNVSNKAGNSCVKTITNNYIETITKPYMNDFQWDSSSQTLTFSCVKMFDTFRCAIQDNHIDNFIANIDPTTNMDDKCIEECEEFINYISDNNQLPRCKHSSTVSGSYVASHST